MAKNRIPVSPAKVNNPDQEGGKKWFSKERRLAFLLAAIALIVYINTVSNGFAVDDSVMLTNNTIVAKGIPGIPELLSTPHQRGFHEIKNDEYRPLSLVVFSVVYQFFGLDPRPYHLLNVFLFAGCVALLFLFLYALFDKKNIVVAFIASLLFALHPLHTEVVANIKSGDELMSFFFAFLSLLVFTRYTLSGKGIHLIAGAFCFFLSFLAKESVVTFLAIIPLVFLWFKSENRRRSLYVCCAAVMVTVIFLSARYLVLAHYHANEIAKMDITENMLAKPGLSVESRLATALLILGHYLKLLLVPYPLIFDYSYGTIPYAHFSNLMVLLSVAAYVALAVVCIWLFARRRNDPYAFAIAFFLITLSVFSNVLVLVKSTMGERFMFYPSVGFCLLAALFIERWLLKSGGEDLKILRSPRALAILVPVCVMYAVMTIDRNRDWENNLTIYNADTKKAPDNCRLNYWLGYETFSLAKSEPNAATQAEMLNAAIKYFHKSLNVYPFYVSPMSDLGAAYYIAGRDDSAEYYDRAALRIDPLAIVTRNNLSGVFLKQKRFRENVSHCRETIRLIPADIFAYADIGVCYTNLGQNDSAAYWLYKGIEADPKFYGCYDVLAYMYHTMGKDDSAIKYQSIARSLSANPN